MKELLSSTDFWASIITLWVWLICPAVAVIYWLCRYMRLERARNRPKTKRGILQTVMIGISMYISQILVPRSRGKNNWRNRWYQEAEEFKRLAEIEELKKRPCEAMLPDAPQWHCTCGRVNEQYMDTCVCGKNRREL